MRKVGDKFYEVSSLANGYEGIYNTLKEAKQAKKEMAQDDKKYGIDLGPYEISEHEVIEINPGQDKISQKIITSAMLVG